MTRRCCRPGHRWVTPSTKPSERPRPTPPPPDRYDPDALTLTWVSIPGDPSLAHVPDFQHLARTTPHTEADWRAAWDVLAPIPEHRRRQVWLILLDTMRPAVFISPRTAALALLAAWETPVAPQMRQSDLLAAVHDFLDALLASPAGRAVTWIVEHLNAALLALRERTRRDR